MFANTQILARNLSTAVQPRKPNRRLFVPPSPPEQTSTDRINNVPVLKDELVPTGNNSLSMIEEDLHLETDRFVADVNRLQDTLDALNRMQRK